MKLDNPDNYKLIKFEKSNTKTKKYDAILENKLTKKLKRIPFGSITYQHYKDSTPLKLYSHLDHNDTNRRRLYYLRHNKDYPKFSSDWLSKTYLW